MRNFYRAFFTLKEEQAGYAVPGRSALGKCIVEARGQTGRIYVATQDLRPKTQFGLYLIKSGSERSCAVLLGVFETDFKSKSEARFEFSADSVGDTGIAVESFDVAVIVTKDSVTDRSAFVAPLAGYKDGKVRWMDNLIRLPETTEPDITKSEIIEQEIIEAEMVQPEITKTEASESDIPETEAVEKADAADNMEVSANAHDTFRFIARRFNEELEALSVIASDEVVRTEPAVPQNTNTDKDSDTIFALSKIVQTNTPMTPFDADETNIQWTRFSLSELALLPIGTVCGAAGYETQAFIAAGFFCYNHLIIGEVSGDKEYHILGVPDVYDAADLQAASKMGFSRFKPCTGELTHGTHGYWLMDL